MTILSLQNFSTGIVGVIILVLLSKVTQNRFISPLRKIPGPWLPSITGQWLVFVDMAGNRTSTIDGLHHKYGPVVRIGPNEISYSSPEVVKELYGPQTQFLKAPVYDDMSRKPAGIFSMRNKADHARRRRLLSPAFSQAALNDIEPTVDGLIQKLLLRLSKSFGKPIDMLLAFRLLSLDIVGTLFLGQSFEALDRDRPHPFLEWMDNNFIDLGLKASFPTIHALLVILPFAGTKALVTASEKIISYGETRFNQYIQENGRQSQRKDLLTKILNTEVETGEQTMTDYEIYTEVGNMIFAGTDTTSTTLTYLCWELAKNPGWQDKLRKELTTDSNSAGNDELPQYKVVLQLPVLDAVINESLRLHPAAPASLARSTPAGGRVLDGFFVPEGTVVSMQNWTTHRDPIAFPDPNRWDPGRWLSPNKSADSERAREVFMPFSKGPRNCLGKGIALMELKKTVATLVTQTRFHVASSTKDEDMAMIDHFLAIPKGGKCELIFERI